VKIDSTTIAVGHAAQATAVALDKNGAVISGKTATWAFGNPIVSISPTGLITGKDTGSVNIFATIDTVVGKSFLRVTPGSAPSAPTAPPPPAPAPTTPPPPILPNPNPSPGHPHEPAGFAQQAAWSGDVIENNDYYPSAAGGGNLSIVTDPDIVAAGGSSANVGKTLFPGGMQSGVAPANLWVKHMFDKSAVYVSFYIKLDPNYNGNEGAGANKILYWEMIPPNSGSQVSMGSIEFFGIGSGNFTAGIVAEGITGFVQGSDNPNGAPPTVRLDGNVQNPTWGRGVWHHYEVLFVNNTPGNTDGTIKWWFDGQLFGDFTNRIKFNNVGANFRDLWFSPTYGGGGPPVPHDMWMYLKDLYISGK
jgi:hypothetical protein